MANKITGYTDISQAMSVNAANNRAILIIGEPLKTEQEVPTAVANTIYTISGTIDAKNKFGSISPVPDMVRALIANGISLIKAIAIGEYGLDKPYTDKATAIDAALKKSLDDPTIKVIVLDTLDSTVVTKVKAHLAVAESEDKFRYFCTGFQSGAAQSLAITTAQGMNNKRIIMAYPNVVNDSNVEQGGIITACCIASVIVNEAMIDPALPTNSVEIKGFGGLASVLLSEDITALVNAGITPLIRASSGNGSIHRMVTTYTTDANDAPDVTWHDATTIFIADDVLESVENRLKQNYKRTKNVVRILNSIRTDVIDVLQRKNDLEIIEGFDKSTVSVIKDPADRYGALVDYEFKVVTPLYTITIRQHMKI